ncbi:hypothetical protein Tco_0454197 [Tanacetum coccineum]
MGKDKGENNIKSIDEGPFKMGKFRETLAEGEECAHHLGLEQDRVFADLSPDKKEGFKADIRSELTKDDRESQLYGKFEHFFQNKGEIIHDYYQHEAHANENKMMLERYNQHAIDPLALVSNVSPQQYPLQSSVISPSAYVLPVTYQLQFADNTQLDSSFNPTDDLIKNLTKTVALLA